MNNRQLGLQNIIKSQQIKIAQLKQQLKLVTDISQNRYSDVEKHHVQQLKQKDKIIQFFKSELAVQRKNKIQEKTLNSSIYIRAKENVQEQVIKFKDKNQDLQLKIKQLQIKLQKNVEDYQIKLKKYNIQNKRLNEQVIQYNKNKGAIFIQIQKISKFYKAAMFELPKRKQTLLWVDNLIKFMEHSQSTSTQNHKQLYSFMKNTISEMSKDLLSSISQISLIQQNINKDRDQINQNIKSLLSWNSKQEQKIKIQFQEVCKIIKSQRQNKQKEEIQQYKYSLKNLQYKHQVQVTELSRKLKQFQVQKKSLVLAFQQVKNFYQNKQQTHKQEIMYLKQTVTDLLDSARFRQKQFQQQIGVLSSQIQSISQRYYQNIQFPIIKINQKVSLQIQKVKYQLTKFNDSILFKQTLDKLSENIPKYILMLGKEVQQNQNIQSYLQKGTQLLTNAMTLVYEASTKNMPNSQHISQTQNNQGVIQLQRSIKQIQWKQKQSKYMYQINVLKKHNQKLNQLALNIQKKVKGNTRLEIRDQKTVQTYIHTQRKSANSQIQAEALTKLNKQYESLLKTQIQKVYKKIQTMKDSRKKEDSVYESIKQCLKKLQESHSTIIQMVKHQNLQNNQIKNSLRVMNNILIKPTLAFQSLANQLSTIAIKTQHTSPIKSQRKTHSLSHIDLNQYKQILTKKHQLNISSTKAISQLIKTIKQNFSGTKQTKKRQIQIGLQKQKHPKHAKQLSEKKLKELQVCQNRYRQQISHSLIKIQNQMQSLQQKYSKKSKVNQTKKIQLILQNKIKLLIEQLNVRQKNSSNQFGGIKSNAIKDIQVKLKQCVVQNQGLMKQLNVLHQLKKI